MRKQDDKGKAICVFDLTLETCIGFVLCEMFPIVTPLIVTLVGIED